MRNSLDTKKCLINSINSVSVCVDNNADYKLEYASQMSNVSSVVITAQTEIRKDCPHFTLMLVTVELYNW